MRRAYPLMTLTLTYVGKVITEWRSFEEVLTSVVKKLLTKKVQLYNTRIPCFNIYLIIVYYWGCRATLTYVVKQYNYGSPAPLCRGEGRWKSKMKIVRPFAGRGGEGRWESRVKVVRPFIEGEGEGVRVSLRGKSKVKLLK